MLLFCLNDHKEPRSPGTPFAHVSMGIVGTLSCVGGQMTTQPRPSGVVAVQKSEHAGRVAKLDHGQNAMPWLYLHTLKATSPRSMSVNGIVALCMCPQSQKRGLATLCCRKSRGEASATFRGNTSTGGLKLGGHLPPRSANDRRGVAWRCRYLAIGASTSGRRARARQQLQNAPRMVSTNFRAFGLGSLLGMLYEGDSCAALSIMLA